MPLLRKCCVLILALNDQIITLEKQVSCVSGVLTSEKARRLCNDRGLRASSQWLRQLVIVAVGGMWRTNKNTSYGDVVN